MNSLRFVSGLVCGAFASIAPALQAEGLLYVAAGPANGLGGSTALAGDVNGDGFDDLISGAPFGSYFLFQNGFVQITSGKDGSVLKTLFGSAQDEEFGYDVDGVGDLNADGFDDVIVGRRSMLVGGLAVGAVTVYSGKDSAVLFHKTGTTVDGWFGHAVAGVGDVNKDGKPDFAVGIPDDGTVGIEAGKCIIYSGANGAVLWSFLGTPGVQLGVSIAGAGDVDGDGYADFVAGANLDATNGQYAGAIHVYSGKTGAKLYSRFGNPGSQLGNCVCGVGDRNNDGFADVGAAAFSDSTQSSFGGLIRIYNGKTGAILQTLLAITPSEGFGYSFDAMGDVDADGIGDFVVGAPYRKESGVSVGASYLVSGANGAALTTLLGASANSYSGWSVCSAGDQNSDGYADFAVGSPSAPTNGVFGCVRVFSTVCGTIANFGGASACAGSGGFTPSFAALPGNCATPGGDVSFALSGGVGGSVALVFVGVNQAAVPVQGCTLLTFPIVLSATVPLQGAGPGNGFAFLGGELPATTPLVDIFMQAFTVDPTTPRGFATSAGVKITVK